MTDELARALANSDSIDLISDEATVVVVRFEGPMNKDAAKLYDTLNAVKMEADQ